MRRWIRGLSVGAGVTCLLAGLTGVPGAQAAPSTPQASQASQAPQASTAEQHVIVLLKNQHPEAPAGRATIGRRHQLVAADQARLVDQARGRGGRDFRQLNVANAFAATVPASEAAQLAADPAVAEVVPDRVLRAPAHDADTPAATAPRGTASNTVCPADPAHPQLEPEALQLTHSAASDPAVPSAQDTATGKGVTVAFLADGIDVDNPDFIRPDGSHVITDYQDFSGDGLAAPGTSHEAFGDASSIAAQGRQSHDLANYVNPAHPLPAGCTIRVLGVAPGANLVALKLFSAGGSTFDSAYLAALDWAVSHDHANVINESFFQNRYPDTDNDPIAVFNEQLVAAGVTVVAISGDGGPFNSIASPGSGPGVISVGATTTFRSYAQTTAFGFQLSNGRYRSDSVSAISSSGVTQAGRAIDLVAPGDLGWALCTPDTARFTDCTNNGGRPSDLQLFGGTSEAAPLVAGAAALVIQAYRDSHAGASPAPDLVRRLLTSTADDLGLPAAEQGAGRLNSLRAVSAARATSAPAGSPGTAPVTELLAGKQQLDLTTTGPTAIGQVSVTNLSGAPRTVQAALRSADVPLTSASQQVTLQPGTSPTFVDHFGSSRAYAKTTFTVPPGASRLVASAAWPGVGGTVVRIVLLEPDGTYAGFSQPQGGSNFGTVDVPSPVAGTWAAVLYTANSATAGFSGTVSLTTASYGTNSGGAVSPASFTLAPHQSQTVTVQPRASRTGGDGTTSLVFSGGGPNSTVPVVVRTVVDLSGGHASVDGSFAGGNGRPGVPNPTQTYAFDVPSGARDLSVGLTVTGNPNQALYGFLVDPSGEPVSVRTNQRAGGSLVDGLQLNATAPRPGRWQLMFTVLGPVSGSAVSTAYTASFTLNASRVGVSGLPVSAGTTLPAGKPVSATVSFANTGAADAAYFVDGRLSTSGNLPLVVQNANYTRAGATVGPFPAVRMPTQSDSFTMAAQVDQKATFEALPVVADPQLNLAMAGDPDRVAGPAGPAPRLTVADPSLAPLTWLVLPQLIGPFPGAAPTAHFSFAGSVHTRLFDRAVRASTGDPLLSYVDATAPASTPVRVAVGAQGTVSVTITPSGPAGTVVKGVLYLDTIDTLTGSADEVAAIPYAYTVG